ncbi:MAG: SDR family NAD(P)-dependent oxidoreductase [wastewater metagenome]|nr:SDR family NAD(P)-dependent oxidoreductase [Candidatus Loosdrechtia aerotolerans]
MVILKGQRAVVTGASSGIGKAIALSLASQGVSVCLVGRNLQVLEDMAKEMKGVSPGIECYQADITLDADIEKLRACLHRDFGSIDILIHSAGICSMGRFENTSVEHLDKQYQINVRAPYLLTQVLLPFIISRRGQIVFINSSIGLSTKANFSQYAATKHALKAIADTLRAEVNTRGVRVVSIYPGKTATPMQEAIHEREGRTYRPEQLMQAEDIASVTINVLSLPRSAEVTDIHIRPCMKSE